MQPLLLIDQLLLVDQVLPPPSWWCQQTALL